jgi:hypothetical protein
LVEVFLIFVLGASAVGEEDNLSDNIKFCPQKFEQLLLKLIDGIVVVLQALCDYYKALMMQVAIVIFVIYSERMYGALCVGPVPPLNSILKMTHISDESNEIKIT